MRFYPYFAWVPKTVYAENPAMITEAKFKTKARSVRGFTNPNPGDEERGEILALMKFTKRGMCALEISEANFLSLQSVMSHLQELIARGRIVRVLRDGILLHELA